ncbi:MAG: DUF5681 domain-containing protein [Paracoccaceae bacterium]
MADKSDDGADKVGYGRPPKHSQFKPGQSGNPRGRPKGARGFRNDLADALNAPVRIVEGGRRRTITTQAAALRRLVDRALSKSDLRAIERLLSFARELDDEPTAAAVPLTEEDQRLIASALERLGEKP